MEITCKVLKALSPIKSKLYTDEYSAPSTKPFMINYRVDNIVALVDELKKDNVTIIDEISEFEYGKFVHVLDPEGNVIELWEPAEESDQG